MKTSRTIKSKALFLLISFSLNSVVGFACSLGFDMGFNSGHHNQEGEEKHEHNHDGHTKGNDDHHHDKGPHKHNHHSHGDSEKHNDGNTIVFKAPLDDNCCKDIVLDFQTLDKQLVQKSYPAKQKIEYVSFIIPLAINLNRQVYTKPVRTPPKIPDHSPPDIIILIQSFLI